MEVLEQSAVVLAGSIPIISVLFSRTHVFFFFFYVGVMEIRKIQVKVSIAICLQINIQGGQ